MKQAIVEQGRHEIFTLPGSYYTPFHLPGPLQLRIILPMMRAIIAIIACFLCAGLPAPAAPQDVEGMPRPAHPRGPSAGLYQRRAVSRMLEGSFEPVDTLRLLVFRVSFTDLDFNGAVHDSVYFANELRHVREYFIGASGGVFRVGSELAAGVTELSFEAAYYGEEDLWEERVAEILIEVVQENDDAVDFSRYDAFAIIHAGAGQETDFNGDSPWQLWSGFIDPIEMAEALADTLGTPGVPTGDLVGADTFYVDNVMVLPEEASQDGLIFGALGIYCYQVGMRLGMIPLYDTTPGGFPDSQGIGAFGLMGYGLYNASGFIPAFPCAFHRYLMGWIEPVRITGPARVRLTDVSGASGEGGALARIDISPTEYLLLENRLHDFDMDGRFDFGDANGNGIPENVDTLLGAEFDFFLTATTNPYHYEEIDGRQVRITDTGSGLMVWHIDEAIIRTRLLAGGYPNDVPRMSGVDLEEADGVQDLDKPGGPYAFGSWGDSYRAGWYARFGPATIPSSEANTGRKTGIGIEVVTEPGTEMLFDIAFGADAHRIEAEPAGDVTGLCPVTVDLDGDGDMDLVQAADTGIVYIGWNAAADGWDGSLEPAIEIPGAVWTGTPVVAELSGGPPLEIVGVSADGRIHAYSALGMPFPIDTDGTPGSLEIPGAVMSMPLALQADDDAPAEVVVLSSDGDTVWCFYVGRSLPIEGGFTLGAEVRGRVLCSGALCSHPVAGDGPGGDGFYALASPDSQHVRLIHFFVSPSSTGYSVTDWALPGARVPDGPVTASTGDIDGDGAEEFVAALPGIGLFYHAIGRGLHSSAVSFNGPGAPALADLDGDGVLETLVRDRSSLHLLTGFGIEARGWPVGLGEWTGLLEGAGEASQPLAADIDGDGRLEAVFNVAGEIWAFDRLGRVEAGWPLRGESDLTVSPAVTGADGPQSMRLFVAGGPERILDADQTGLEFGTTQSGLARVDLEVPWTGDGWTMFRHDPSGTGRQAPPGATAPEGPLADGSTFICYPNPVRGGSFKVRIDLTGSADVTVKIFTLEGDEVYAASLRHEWESGVIPFEAAVPVDGLASGIYICHLDVTGGGAHWTGARKVAVLK